AVRSQPRLQRGEIQDHARSRLTGLRLTSGVEATALPTQREKGTLTLVKAALNGRGERSWPAGLRLGDQSLLALSSKPRVAQVSVMHARRRVSGKPTPARLRQCRWSSRAA